MKQLVIFPKGSLSPNDKSRMAKEGILAIECDEPSRVVAVIPGAPLLSSDDLLLSAMDGLLAPVNRHCVFAESVTKRLRENSAKKELK